MSGDLDHQSRLLNEQRTAAATARSVSLNGLRILLKIRAQNLPQIRIKRSLPSNGKDLSGGRDIFLYGHASRCLDFLYVVRIAAGGPQRSLHFHLIRPDRARFTSQRGKQRKRQSKHDEYALQ